MRGVLAIITKDIPKCFSVVKQYSHYYLTTPLIHIPSDTTEILQINCKIAGVWFILFITTNKAFRTTGKIISIVFTHMLYFRFFKIYLWCKLPNNHRMTEAGKHLSRNGFHKQGHPELIVQNCVQMAFEYLRGWRLHSFSRQPVPEEKLFPVFQSDSREFHFIPTASSLDTGHTENNLAVSSVHHPFRYLYALMGFLSLLFSTLNCTSSFSLLWRDALVFESHLWSFAGFSH